MQFSKLVLHPRKIEPDPTIYHLESINGNKVCKRCGIREAGGYAGNGVVLANTCVKCFRSAGIESRERAREPKFYNRGGRS